MNAYHVPYSVNIHQDLFVKFRQFRLNDLDNICELAFMRFESKRENVDSSLSLASVQLYNSNIDLEN